MSTVQAIPFSYDDAKHLYERDGVAKDSVTQILAARGYSNFSVAEQVRPLEVERGRQIGKLAHQASHFWDEDQKTQTPEVMAAWELRLPDVIRVRLQGYKGARAATGYIPVINEGRYIFRTFGMEYGGTFDNLGIMPNKRWSLWDLKFTDGAPMRSWGLQTIAYELGIKAAIREGHFPFALTPDQIRGILSTPFLRVIPQIFKDGNFKLHTSDDPKSKIFFPEDAQVWQSALCITLDQRNHGGN